MEARDITEDILYDLRMMKEIGSDRSKRGSDKGRLKMDM